jgi:hypothetical protein
MSRASGTTTRVTADWSDYELGAWPHTADFTPAQLLHHGRQLQRAGRAESTRVNYLHWWRVFAQFTVQVGWAATEDEVPLPVSEEVMLM